MLCNKTTDLFFLLGAVVLGLMARPADAAAPAAGVAHDYSFTDIDGAPLPLSQFAGQAVLVVNTASRCGFTRQYGGLQSLWEAYRAQGLTVLGVPSNDFGRQEPGSEAEIKEFCKVNFGVNFPLTQKERVSGDGAHPFYKWARSNPGADAPGWNFHKYLIGRDGRLIASFSSGVDPMSDKMTAAVEEALAAPSN